MEGSVAAEQVSGERAAGRPGLLQRAPMLGSALGAAVLCAAMLVGCAVGSYFFGTGVMTRYLIDVVALVGLGLFVGNTGIVSLGHMAFYAIGAYVTALVTMTMAAKSTTLPELPAWLAEVTIGLVPAMLVVAALAAVVAFVFGIALVRLPGYSAAIASLGLLVVVNVVLLGAKDFTRGAQALFGAPLTTTFALAAGVAIAAILIARLFRDSPLGLQLRASREDETAARTLGVWIPRGRLIAWVLSAVIVSMAGVLYAGFLGAFSPKDFYFTQTFTLLAALIVGGSATVTGAVVGAALFSIVIETVGPLESGFDLAGIQVPEIFGATQVVLSLALLGVVYFLRAGLFGRRELDQVLAAGGRRLAVRFKRPRTTDERSESHDARS